MSSWGYTDNVAIKGTVQITTTANTVVGTSTEFTSNVKVGDFLTINGVKQKVHAVLSNTSIYLSEVGSANVSGQTAYLQQAPKYLTTENAIQRVYGVTVDEMNTQSLDTVSVYTSGNYPTNAKPNTTVTISTTGASQPSKNATATVNFTGANVTSITITDRGAGYTTDVQQNTIVTIATTGATQPTQNATANLVFTTGTSTANASHQGWVSFNSYTDGQGSERKKSEVLVAMSKNFTNDVAGDNENTSFPN